MLKVKEEVQMEDARKATAAIAAVLQYIKTEEEAIAIQAATQAAQPQMPMFAKQPTPTVRPWGVSGRQAQMQLRNLMQLRTFRKL